MDNGQLEQKSIKAREKYVSAFNGTMLKIWRERITLLGVIDTGKLLRSPISVRMDADGKFAHCELSLAFLEYGLWQDYGVGREVYRGNPGDIGRPKKRQRRPWFSKKFFASFMNLKEFMADSLGQEFVGMLHDVIAPFDGRSRR